MSKDRPKGYEGAKVLVKGGEWNIIPPTLSVDHETFIHPMAEE